MRQIRPKKQGKGLEFKTFDGESGRYLVFLKSGAYHVFKEVEAKQAAMDCNSSLHPNTPTREMWRKLWRRP